MGFSVKHRGSFDNTDRFLQKMTTNEIYQVLDAAGRVGVNALAGATPIDSGSTANMWGYEIVEEDGSYKIFWTNDNEIQGFYVVIGLQYGHATGSGGYVVGRDFINPTIQPIFDLIVKTVWNEVSNA